jgi:general secretion pathway protein H
MRHRASCAGSSLLEMLVVLTIMSLMIAVAAPLLSRRSPGSEVRLKGQEIAALMRQARTLAVNENREVSVAVDIKEKRVMLAGVGRPVVMAESTGLRLVTARGLLTEKGASIDFTPTGGSTGGSLEISDGKATVTIAVSWLTADVRTSVEAAK